MEKVQLRFKIGEKCTKARKGGWFDKRQNLPTLATSRIFPHFAKHESSRSVTEDGQAHPSKNL